MEWKFHGVDFSWEEFIGVEFTGHRTIQPMALELGSTTYMLSIL